MTNLINDNDRSITIRYKHIQIILSFQDLKSIEEIKKHIYKILTDRNKTFYINLRRRVLYFCKDFEFNLNFSDGAISVDDDEILIALNEYETRFQHVIDLNTCELEKINLDTRRKNYYEKRPNLGMYHDSELD